MGEVFKLNSTLRKIGVSWLHALSCCGMCNFKPSTLLNSRIAIRHATVDAGVPVNHCSLGNLGVTLARCQQRTFREYFAV
jgi:hypothetical protein